MNVEHAVRLLAGSFVGISLIGYLVHSPHWLWLAAFVCLNLVQSSFTDICPAEWIFQWMGLPSCVPADAGDSPHAEGGRDAPQGAWSATFERRMDRSFTEDVKPMNTHRWLAGVLILLLVPGLAAAREVDPRELAFRSYHAAYFQGDDVKSRAHLRIEDDQDRVRTRTLTILRKDLAEDRQKYYAYFHEPSDIRRMVFLVWTRPGEDDDRWLYLPSIDLVQRITGSQKRNSFAGSDFTYEDMTGRYPGNDTFAYRGTRDLDGTEVHVLKGTPKHPGRVEFSHYEAFVNTETYLPEKAVFYTPQGDKHRTMTLEEARVVDGHLTPVKQRVVNHQTGSHTTAEMTGVDYEVSLPERVFEKRFLRRPPTPWVQPQQ